MKFLRKDKKKVAFTDNKAYICCILYRIIEFTQDENKQTYHLPDISQAIRKLQ
jgi:hypothetical protein